jgi:hypothetical protein
MARTAIMPRNTTENATNASTHARMTNSYDLILERDTSDHIALDRV